MNSHLSFLLHGLDCSLVFSFSPFFQPPERLVIQIKNAKKKKRIFAKVRVAGVSRSQEHCCAHTQCIHIHPSSVSYLLFLVVFF